LQNNRYLLMVLTCVLGCLLVSPPAAAQGEEPRQTQAMALLGQIQYAARQLSYTGVFVYQQGEQVRASSMTHLVSGQDELEKVEMLDGQRREYIRRNDEVTRYLPESRTMLIEKRLTRDIFPAILVANTNDLAHYYHVELQGMERVAGLNCQIVLLRPIDKFRYGYKLCAGQDTQLLLRAQTLDEQNKVVEQILFTSIDIGKMHFDSVKPSFPDTSAWQVRHADIVEKISLPKWEITPPPGFKQIQAVRHVLKDRSSNQAGMRPTSDSIQREVSQLVYSDGLAAISVFIEPNSSDRIERVMRQGAMNIIGRRHGQYWLTVMGEAPDLAIRQVINSIKLIN
jgi:sigma-E factor negative regulatory protein RseB